MAYDYPKECFICAKSVVILFRILPHICKEREQNKIGKLSSDLNFGLIQVKFPARYPYRAGNLVMDKPTFIAKIQFYFFLVP